jgi:hypothetical protein
MEVVDCQLNATSLYMIQQAMGEDDRPYNDNDTTAKSSGTLSLKCFLEVQV